jgi:type II secretory pathway component PulF
MKRSDIAWWFAGLGMGLLAPLVAFVIWLAVTPAFRETFEAFGATVPWFTQAVLDTPPWPAALVSVVVLVGGLAWPRPSQRARVAAALGATGLLLVPMLMMLGLYLPILALSTPT